MKRNWETLKKVLEAAEEDRLAERMDELAAKDEDLNKLAPGFNKSNLEGEFIGHLWLACDADLILGVDVKHIGYGGEYHVAVTKDARLTMQGHDVLDGLRSQKICDMIHKTMSEASIPLTVDLVKAVISYGAKLAVSLTLGKS